MKQQNGFTIVELMVSVAILGLLTALAVPSFSEWLVRIRVDNEISSLHRTILTARNTAVNLEQPVTICPLDGNTCSADWTRELSVFVDLNNNGQLESGVSIDINNDGINESIDETVIRTKAAITAGDDLDYGTRTRLVYLPTGQIAGGGIGTFVYCASGHADKNRGIVISMRGRAYATQDFDNDGKDETRTGQSIECS